MLWPPQFCSIYAASNYEYLLGTTHDRHKDFLNNTYFESIVERRCSLFLALHSYTHMWKRWDRAQIPYESGWWSPAFCFMRTPYYHIRHPLAHKFHTMNEYLFHIPFSVSAQRLLENVHHLLKITAEPMQWLTKHCHLWSIFNLQSPSTAIISFEFPNILLRTHLSIPSLLGLHCSSHSTDQTLLIKSKSQNLHNGLIGLWPLPTN